MRNFVTFIVALTLCSALAFASTLSDFPSMYASSGNFSAVYVIGQEAPALDVVSATLVSTSLATYNLTTLVGTSRLDNEVGDVTLLDAIVIGSPCENRAAAQLEGNPNPCYVGLAGSAGYLKLFENNGKKQLLISGLTAEDRHQAARFLAREDLTSLKVKSFIIPTTTKSQPPTSAYYNLTNATTSAQNTTPTTNNTTVMNVTPVTPKPAATNITQNKTKVKPPIGAYEPLDRSIAPKKKGFFASIWAWLTGWFT